MEFPTSHIDHLVEGDSAPVGPPLAHVTLMTES